MIVSIVLPLIRGVGWTPPVTWEDGVPGFVIRFQDDELGVMPPTALPPRSGTSYPSGARRTRKIAGTAADVAQW